MKHYPQTTMSCLCVALLAGCNGTSVKEEKAAASMAPMENPNHQVGHTRSMLRDGKAYSSKIIAVADGLMTRTTSDGCQYQARAMFAPAVAWENCGPDNQQTGSRTVKQTGGAWPLSVGKTWSYAIEGRNNKGDSWTNSRSCEVLSTAQITTHSGTHDTYKVRCDDKSNERMFYISPVLNDFAQLIHYKKRWNETINYEVLESS